MPPKDKQSKADLAKKQKIVEDKTFGLKNKKKSKNVQKYVQNIQASAQPKPDPSKLAAKKKKDEEKAREKELNDLFKVAVTQPKVPVGVDPKSILCEFFKAGMCAKGFKCKFSHDLNVQRKGEKIDIYSDKRDDPGTMEDWDQDTLEKVVAEKNREYNHNKPTDIICKFFLEAVEKKQYGWFWVCPNGSKGCHYRHALPPGYILKSQMKALLAEESSKVSIEEEIEDQRAKTTRHTTMTTEIFNEWKRKKIAEKEAGMALLQAERAKNDRMSGRELFMANASLFVDDIDSCEKYQREDEANTTATPKDKQSIVQDEGPSTSILTEADAEELFGEDDDDDELDIDELNELEASLSKTSISSSDSLSIWGISLLSGDERGDVILLKFLRARDFNPVHAHAMLLRCLEWRKDFDTDGILDEDLVGMKELEGVVAYMYGIDRVGHPVCYNAYGVFKDGEMYDRVFGDDEKLKRFLRWRVQVMERGVDLLEFKPGGINSIIQVTDLKDMPKSELRVASKQILSLFQDNYPEMVARKIFVNVPWYFTTLYSMFSPFLTQRTKSKFVIAKEGNVAETLYRFIRPEFVPVQYGGLSRPGDLQKGQPKPASEFTVKGGEKVNLEIDGIDGGATITWDLVVGGWELEYCAEYIPSAAGGYTIAIKKTTRMSAGDDPIHSAYTSKETGKMVLSIDNTGSRRKKVAAYRYFVRKPTTATAASGAV